MLRLDATELGPPCHPLTVSVAVILIVEAREPVSARTASTVLGVGIGDFKPGPSNPFYTGSSAPRGRRSERS